MIEPKITAGQGEYIVFHQSPTGKLKQVSPEMFEKAYQILLEHLPAKVTSTDRYEAIKSKLKQLDPTLEAVFVPRTLYELIFIRKCINEDIRQKEICPYVNPFHRGKLERERKCWHVCHFTNAGDSEHPDVKRVAYRLNKAIVKAFAPSSEGFSLQDLFNFAEREIQYLKDHYQKCLEIRKNLTRGESALYCNVSTPGPTTNFGYESTKGSIKSMCIRNEKDAQIIRNAIDLECSKLAQDHLFLYRGANLQKESATDWVDENKAYSLSYGSSLFAGCIYDGGASAFHYMLNGKNAYAIPISFDQLDTSPFYVPITHTVAQLFGLGEIFHARTKAWKDFDLERLGGMNSGGYGDERDSLASNLGKEELISQFQEYKSKAIQLK